MRQRKYDVGYVQGDWTILERPFGSDKALMRCVCGTEGWYFLSNLSSNRSTRCKDCKRQSSEHKIWKSVQRTALRRGLEWNLSYEEWFELAFADCYYCGTGPSNFLYGTKYNGIDRIDSSVKFYDADNVVTACRICNRAKSDLSAEEFNDWIKRVYGKQFI